MEYALDGGPSVPDGQWRVVSVSHEITDEFLACGPGRPVVSRMKGTRLMCGVSVEF